MTRDIYGCSTYQSCLDGAFLGVAEAFVPPGSVANELGRGDFAALCRRLLQPEKLTKLWVDRCHGHLDGREAAVCGARFLQVESPASRSWPSFTANLLRGAGRRFPPMDTGFRRYDKKERLGRRYRGRRCAQPVTGPRAPSPRETGRGKVAALPRAGVLLRRRCLRGLDELRHPAVAATQTLAVHRLELGWREGVGRRPRHQRVAPRLDARELLDDAELPDPVEEDIALQERRIG